MPSSRQSPDCSRNGPQAHALDHQILGPAGHMVTRKVASTLKGRITFQRKQPWSVGCGHQERLLKGRGMVTLASVSPPRENATRRGPRSPERMVQTSSERNIESPQTDWAGSCLGFFALMSLHGACWLPDRSVSLPQLPAGLGSDLSVSASFSLIVPFHPVT